VKRQALPNAAPHAEGSIAFRLQAPDYIKRPINAALFEYQVESIAIGVAVLLCGTVKFLGVVENPHLDTNEVLAVKAGIRRCGRERHH
jgi:hypothetical protein